MSRWVPRVQSVDRGNWHSETHERREVVVDCHLVATIVAIPVFMRDRGMSVGFKSRRSAWR
jgi:hypothetical protein